jgi:type II secretory pathway component GspD/PulD (secretin)
MAITQEQVYTAANSIATAGKTATVAAVRAYLGTGSFSTITPILREWAEAQALPTISVGHAETAPQQIIDVLMAMAPHVWATAAQKANEHLVIERSAMDIERTKMLAALADSTATGEIIAADLETANEQIANLTALVAHMKNDQTVQSALKHEAEIRIAAAEATATERAARVCDLQAVVEQLRADLKIKRC